MKRFWAVILCLLMVLASFPAYADELFTVTATVEGGGGIASPTDLLVARGGKAEFTLIPDAGSMLDELFWNDGRENVPEKEDDGTYKFLKENIQGDAELRVSFMPFDTYDIFIQSPVNGSVRLEGEAGPVPAGGALIQRITRQAVRLFVTPEAGYRAAGVYMADESGREDEISWALGYDEAEGLLLLDYEPMYSGTLRFEFEQAHGAVYEDIAILSGEAASDAQIKAAMRREYGLRLMPVAEADITDISAVQSHTSDNGVPYGVIGAKVEGQPVSVYVVGSVTNLVFELGLGGGTRVYITNEGEPFAQDVLFEIAAFTEADFALYGPYDARLMTISDDIRACFAPIDGLQYKQRVLSPFYRAQFHAANRGRHDSMLNWFPFTLVQENALCFKVEAAGQEALKWSLDTYPHVTAGAGEQALYFGNDTLTLVPPAGGAGNVAGITAAAPLSRGYTVTNGPDGTVTVSFLSDFYEEVVLTLTLALESGGSAQRALTLRRVGVDIQAHDFGSGAPSRNVFHGTQNGSAIRASGGGYQLTATYYIPDFGGEPPYGLYVTRRYAGGRIETETIRQPLNSPHPSSADFEGGVFLYNDGAQGMANAVDYLIYAGAGKAAAPEEISVLVLKSAPDGSAFGGVDFGAGTGVKWTKR